MKKEIKFSYPMAHLLGLLFIALKLTHQIDWDWKWVLAPFWIPIALVLSFLFVFFFLSLLVALLSNRR